VTAATFDRLARALPWALAALAVVEAALTVLGG
jgi:hypothetical protein